MVCSAASASSSAGLAASSFSSATALSPYSTKWDTHHFHDNDNDDDENGDDDDNNNDDKDTGIRLMVQWLWHQEDFHVLLRCYFGTIDLHHFI